MGRNVTRQLATSSENRIAITQFCESQFRALSCTLKRILNISFSWSSIQPSQIQCFFVFFRNVYKPSTNKMKTNLNTRKLFLSLCEPIILGYRTKRFDLYQNCVYKCNNYYKWNDVSVFLQKQFYKWISFTPQRGEFSN